MTEISTCFDKCERGVFCINLFDEDGTLTGRRRMHNSNTGRATEVEKLIYECSDNLDNHLLDMEQNGLTHKLNERAFLRTLAPVEATRELRPAIPEPSPSNHIRP